MLFLVRQQGSRLLGSTPQIQQPEAFPFVSLWALASHPPDLHCAATQFYLTLPCIHPVRPNLFPLLHLAQVKDFHSSRTKYFTLDEHLQHRIFDPSPSEAALRSLVPSFLDIRFPNYLV